MPHFIIECPEHIISGQTSDSLLNQIHEVVMDSGLFEEANVKVRIKTYVHYLIAGKQQDFIHVFGYIMPGRTPEQQTNLSTAIGELLVSLFPQVPVITVNIDLLNRPAYFKRLV